MCCGPSIVNDPGQWKPATHKPVAAKRVAPGRARQLELKGTNRFVEIGPLSCEQGSGEKNAGLKAVTLIATPNPVSQVLW
jgi:hypothetical protein